MRKKCDNEGAGALERELPAQVHVENVVLKRVHDDGGADGSKVVFSIRLKPCQHFLLNRSCDLAAHVVAFLKRFEIFVVLLQSET